MFYLFIWKFCKAEQIDKYVSIPGLRNTINSYLAIAKVIILICGYINANSLKCHRAKANIRNQTYFRESINYALTFFLPVVQILLKISKNSYLKCYNLHKVYVVLNHFDRLKFFISVGQSFSLYNRLLYFLIGRERNGQLFQNLA